MPKTQRRVSRDATLAVNDTGNAVHRHIDLARKLGSRDSDLAQFFGKMFTGVDGGTRHQSLLSMIVDDFHIHWPGRSFRPLETDPPLIVDADRKLSGAVAFEGFESVTGQSRQIGKACGCLEPIKTHLGLP